MRNGASACTLTCQVRPNSVEIVDIEAADGRLQRVEEVGDLDAEHLRLVAVDVEIDLRRVGGEGAEHAGEFGLLVRRDQQAAQGLGDFGRRLALQSLEDILEAAGVAEPEDRRQVEGKTDRLLDRRQPRAQLGDDRARALGRVGPLLVGLQTDDEEGLVRRGDAVDEVEADDGEHALDAGDAADDVLRLRRPPPRCG